MASTGSGNDLSHVWCQAITWSHASYFSVYVWLISIVYVKDLCRDWTNTMVYFHDEINNLFKLFQCVLHFLSILPVINNITTEFTRGDTKLTIRVRVQKLSRTNETTEIAHFDKVQYFSKPGDTFLVLPGRRNATARLAWRRLGLSCAALPGQARRT